MRTLTVVMIRMGRYLRKKSSWIFLLLLPILFSYFALGLFDEEDQVGKIPVVVVDQDQSRYSRMLIELLEQESYLEVLENDLEGGLEALKKNQVEGVYRIPEGFGADITRDRIPELGSYTTTMAQGGNAVGEIIISRVIRILSSARAANIIVSEAKADGNPIDENRLWQEAFNKSESYWEPEPLMTLSMEEVVAEGREDEPLESPGTSNAVGLMTGPHGLIMIYLTLFSLRIFYQRQEEETSGINRRQRLVIGKKRLYIGKFIGDYLYLTVHLGIFFVSIYLFQGKGLRGGLFHQILLTGTIQGLLIGVWAVLSKIRIGKDHLVVGLPLGVLITSMISGALWSIEVFPAAMQQIAWVFPQGIYMKAVEYSYLGDKAAFYTALLWSLGFGLILLWIGYRKNEEA